MLRIAIGVLGVLLIGLGFSSDNTLSWFKHKITSPFSSAPSLTAGSSTGLQTPSVTSSTPSRAVATIETLPAASSQSSEPGLVEGEQLVVAAAKLDTTPAPAPTVVEQPAAVQSVAEPEPEPKIEIVPAVATSTEQAPETAIDAVMQKAAAANDDTLFVLKDKVNMREGPSIKHGIVLQLEKGQELMEFKREGKWVHVGAYGTEGTVGWVHGTLVGAQLQ